MGISKVYLVGFDHNYSIPADAIITNKENNILSQSDDPNHFHPGYFGKGYRWHDPRVDRMEKAYMRAKDIYESEGRKVYNASVGGKLEIFPRVDYDTLYQG